jgi:hypothetical protein
MTTALGYGTWHGFEKRAMSYANRFAPTVRSAAPSDQLVRALPPADERDQTRVAGL